MNRLERQPWRHRLGTRLLLWTVGVTVLVLAAVILWSHFSVLDRLEVEARERAAFLAEAPPTRSMPSWRSCRDWYAGWPWCWRPSHWRFHSSGCG